MMRHPYQCVVAITTQRGQAGSKEYLLAACGPKLLSTCLANGARSTAWPLEASVEGLQDGDEAAGERPAKKQKTSPPSPTEPNVIKLVVSPDQQHVVAVTDDKCVRVFSVDGDGELVELSRRYMPKRPCAIQILPDNATILCGDKFGDVYSLPLFPGTGAEAQSATAESRNEATVPKDASAKLPAFKPSASNLTVHTKRNRRALEAQLAQKDFTSRKEPLQFEHKLLLGHVSMLTDLTFATQEVEGRQRGYIITADRDEHIRISRGPPQSHVIEGYCLGHTEFISKICLVPDTNLLVSAGGNAWLGVWEWPSFKLRGKVDLQTGLRQAQTVSTEDSQSDTHQLGQLPMAVSGLWTVPIKAAGGSVSPAMVVAFEKVSCYAVIPSRQLSEATPTEPRFTVRRTDGPLLDVAVVGESVIMSFDPVGNTGGRDETKMRLQAYRFTQSSKESDPLVEDDQVLGKHLETLNSFAGVEADDKKLDQLLYGVAQMRKRRDHDAPEEGAEGAEDE